MGCIRPKNHPLVIDRLPATSPRHISTVHVVSSTSGASVSCRMASLRYAPRFDLAAVQTPEDNKPVSRSPWWLCRRRCRLLTPLFSQRDCGYYHRVIVASPSHGLPRGPWNSSCAAVSLNECRRADGLNAMPVDLISGSYHGGVRRRHRHRHRHGVLPP